MLIFHSVSHHKQKSLLTMKFVWNTTAAAPKVIGSSLWLRIITTPFQSRKHLASAKTSFESTGSNWEQVSRWGLITGLVYHSGIRLNAAQYKSEASYLCSWCCYHKRSTLKHFPLCLVCPIDFKDELLSVNHYLWSQAFFTATMLPIRQMQTYETIFMHPVHKRVTLGIVFFIWTTAHLKKKRNCHLCVNYTLQFLSINSHIL